MEGKIIGTGKRIMTMMLSVIMVTGIFAGMKLEVRAAKNYSFDLVSPGSFTFALQNTYYSDDTLVFTDSIAKLNSSLLLFKPEVTSAKP